MVGFLMLKELLHVQTACAGLACLLVIVLRRIGSKGAVEVWCTSLVVLGCND